MDNRNKRIAQRKTRETIFKALGPDKLQHDDNNER
ncbi:MAG: hypothetical protein Ta2E_01300 [Mycoplasmoidaceae bacterium]|nr:MAG: hypothetical protein Ta2E_01300 [Mycoplasmoidaceae bacterium]